MKKVDCFTEHEVSDDLRRLVWSYFQPPFGLSFILCWLEGGLACNTCSFMIELENDNYLN